MNPLLTVEDLTVRFGGVVALDGVDLSVPEGAIVGLIGPNGAGKTTLLDALTGFVSPERGTVTFEQESLDGLPPQRRARRGLARTFQSLELFEDLNVRENVLAVAQHTRWWTPLLDAVRPRVAGRAETDRALADVGLEADAERLPTELSHGRRRLTTVARALVGQPTLVLLDEPAAGLGHGESAELGALVRTLPERGTSVLLVDHDMGLVLSVCDTIVVVDFGRVVAVGTPREVRRDPAVVRAYLGDRAGGGTP